jgi:COP9 signalosome complex subunit 12
LSAVYTPFIAAYKSGDVGLYDRQLHAAEKRLMERGTYLIVERAREGAVRALLKKT